MNSYIQSIDDLTDSYELISESPKKSMSIFIYILLTLLISAAVWMYFGKIDVYVDATGVVRPNDKINTITNAAAGKVIQANLTDGQTVKKGDVLLKIDTETQSQSLKAYNKQKQELVTDIQNLKKYKQSILSGKNLFDQSKQSETLYYEKYKEYVANLNTISEQYQNNGLDYSKLKSDAALSEQNAQKELEKLEQENKDLEQLNQSVIKGQNLVSSSNSLSFQKYNDYTAEINSYEQTIKTQTSSLTRLESLLNVGGASKSEVQDAKNALNATNLEIEKYKSDFKLSVQQSISDNKKSIDELSATIKSAKSSFAIYDKKSNNTALASEKEKLDTLTQISTQIQTQNSSLDSLNKDIKELSLGLKDTIIKAPIDGTLNLYTEINKSDYIQSGLSIGTIVPNSNDKYKIQVYISTDDIAKIKVNQHVKLRFSSLPYKEYGDFNATLTKISADTKVNSSTNTSYYTAECTLDKQSTSGNLKGLNKIKSGMDCEVKVVTQKKKIYIWLLEKINFIDSGS